MGPVAAGLCSTLVGIGLGRFAYSALIPVLIEHGWFSATDAVYLGAANLAGYLIGAVSARWATHLAPTRLTIRLTMLAVCASFFACTFPLPFAWFFFWRLVSGIGGGVLMILAPSLVLSRVAPSLRGLAGGVMFAGVGVGIVGSATVVPLLADAGPDSAWLALGAIALAATVATWMAWPDSEPGRTSFGQTAALSSPAARFRVHILSAAYGLAALGLVAHMVFLVDYVARGLGRGLDAAALCWALFGVGAVLGPVIAGRIADRFGFGPTIRALLLAEALGVGVLVWTATPTVLAVSSLLVGALVPGLVPVALGRVRELLETEAARRAGWSTATAAFALGQGAGGYGFSYLFGVTGDYRLLFAVGAAAVALGLVIDLAGNRRGRPG
ncbi:MAG: MFS transporter [Rhodospirillaceae bacterium]|nr:MFS transporter [Rhodospirillaceae bacterium]